MYRCAWIGLFGTILGCADRAEPPVSQSIDQPTSSVDSTCARPSHTPGLDGLYCTTSEIGGFSETILELRDGRFRYWFYSDARSSDDPEYPVAGTYQIQSIPPVRPPVPRRVSERRRAIRDSQRYRSVARDDGVIPPQLVGEWLVLDDDRITQRLWFPDTVNGIPVLWREDGLRIWREDRKIYDYAVLVKIENTEPVERDLTGPSVRCLYDKAMQQRIRQWNDPFVFGPQ